MGREERVSLVPSPADTALDLHSVLPLLHPQHGQGGLSLSLSCTTHIRLWGALYFRGCLYLKLICLSLSSCISFCTALRRWNISHPLLCALHAVGMTRVSYPWAGVQVTDPWPGESMGRLCSSGRLDLFLLL